MSRKPRDPFRIGASCAIIIDSQIMVGLVERVFPSTNKREPLPSIHVKLDNGRVFQRRSNHVAPIDPNIHQEITEMEATP